MSGGLQAQCDKVCRNPKVLMECVVCQEDCTSSVQSVWGIQRECRAELLSCLCTGESMVFETLGFWSWSMDFMTIEFFLYPKEIGAVLTADQQAIHNSNSSKGRFEGLWGKQRVLQMSLFDTPSTKQSWRQGIWLPNPMIGLSDVAIDLDPSYVVRPVKVVLTSPSWSLRSDH